MQLNIFDKIDRSVEMIVSEGIKYCGQNYSSYFLKRLFSAKKKRLPFFEEMWCKINFKALGIDANAQLLLNPFDDGFSKDFYVYGFWEPLNTIAIFDYVSKTKPVVLDIEGT
jgi:hypothetical protein